MMERSKIDELKAKYPALFKEFESSPISEEQIAATLEECETFDREKLYILLLRSITVGAVVMAMANGIEELSSVIDGSLNKKAHEA